MLRELWQQGAPSLSDLLAMFQISTKEELKERLKNTSSARTFAEDADRATGSVLFMLAKAADLIQFLRAEGSGAKPFARSEEHRLNSSHYCASGMPASG